MNSSDAAERGSAATHAGDDRSPTTALPSGARALGITKIFGSTVALDDVGIDVRPGEIHALLGGNGSGKSTLIKILCGIHPSEPGGLLEVGGVSSRSDHWSPETARAAGVRVVHQDLGVFLDMSVRENLAIGRGYPTQRKPGISWKTVNEDALELIERFEINASPRDALRSLSATDRTLVAIARALRDEASSQGVLILDEPTASLPADEADRLLATLTRYASAGQAILYVSHRLQEIQKAADRVTVLRDGRSLGTWESQDLDTDRMVELIVGSSVPPAPVRRHPGPETKPLVSVRGLTAGPLRAVDLDLYPGEVLGIAGLRGSGRTSLLRRLFGDARDTGGSITLRGEPVRLRSVRAAMRAGIALVPENRADDASFADMSLSMNLTIPQIRRYWQRGGFRRTQLRADAQSLVSRFSVKAESVDAPLVTLSGGNQQKVIVARWMAIKPTLLLLDEPTQGVDVGARHEIYEMVARAAATDGLAVIVVASDPEELAQASDRVIVLRDGGVATELRGSSITAESIARETHREGAH